MSGRLNRVGMFKMDGADGGPKQGGILEPDLDGRANEVNRFSADCDDVIESSCACDPCDEDGRRRAKKSSDRSGA